jgi:hypothetical protein
MNPSHETPAAAVLAATPGQRLRRLRDDLVHDLFDDDGLATVFTHARNVLTCAMLIAAGSYAAHHAPSQAGPSTWTLHAAGLMVTAVGVVLLLLNLVDGLRRLARRDHSALLRGLAVVGYIGLTLRLAQVVVHFRGMP